MLRWLSNLLGFGQARPAPFQWPEEDHSARGGGQFVARPGLQLKDNRYTLVKKLGHGQYSTVWLAEDAFTPDDPVAVKILTQCGTALHADGLSIELDVLHRLARPPFRFPCSHVIIKDHFVEQQDSHQAGGGKHLCLVTHAYAQSLADYIKTCPDKKVPPRTVKRLVKQILQSLVSLHERDVLHSDIKPSNIFFAADHDIRLEASRVPAEPCDPREATTSDGRTIPLFKSEPITMRYSGQDDAFTSELYAVLLGDFGSAQLLDRRPTVPLIQPRALRAPEVILDHPWSSATDIWNLGCLTFELLTGTWLFRRPLDTDDQHLTQMRELLLHPTGADVEEGLGQGFGQEFLGRCGRRDEFFGADGSLLHPTTFSSPGGLPSLLTSHDLPLSPTETVLCLDFLKQCLRLDPRTRPAAGELWGHGFLRGADCCCDEEEDAEDGGHHHLD